MLKSFLVAAGLLVFLIQGQTTGSVSGRVLDADKGKALSGVRVGSPEIGYAVTDAEGRYTVSGVSPGRVKLSVRVDQLVYGDPKPVSVVAGRETPGIDFRTRLHADITGHIRDEDGNPLSGVQVIAIQSEYTAGGELRYDLANAYYGPNGVNGSDAEGNYKMNVMAGRPYRLFAYKLPRYGQAVSDAPKDPASRLPSYVSVFHPNARTIAGASLIVLESQETRTVDFRISRARSYCLSATLNAGGTPGKMNFLLSEEERFGLESRGFPMNGQGEATGDDGKIRLCDLPPGDYRLTAYRYGPSAPLSRPMLEYSNTVPVKILNQDVENVVVNTSPRITVSGSVEWDSPPLDTPDIKLRFGLSPPAAMNPQTWQVPGQFSFEAAPVMDADLDMSGLEPPFYVKGVSYAGVSILGKSFTPPAGGALRIVIGRDAGSVAARVTDKAGQPAAFSHVILFSATATTVGELAATLHEGLTDENGSYASPSLLPGAYSVFATDAPLPMLWAANNNQANRVLRTPETLEILIRARAKGQFITVGKNSRVEVSLVPIAVN